MIELVGKVLVNSMYSESPSLPPKLSANVTSLSRLLGGLGDAFWPSVGRTWFEFLLPLTTAFGVAVLGAAVSVSSLNARVVLELFVKACHSSPSVRMLVENSGTSEWKTNRGVPWQNINAASWSSSTSWVPLVVRLKVVGNHGLYPGGGVQVGPLLWKVSSGQPLVQGRLAACRLHAWVWTHFMPSRCMQHSQIVREKGREVPEVQLSCCVHSDGVMPWSKMIVFHVSYSSNINIYNISSVKIA